MRFPTNRDCVQFCVQHGFLTSADAVLYLFHMTAGVLKAWDNDSFVQREEPPVDHLPSNSFNKNIYLLIESLNFEMNSRTGVIRGQSYPPTFTNLSSLVPLWTDIISWTHIWAFDCFWAHYTPLVHPDLHGYGCHFENPSLVRWRFVGKPTNPSLVRSNAVYVHVCSGSEAIK